MISTNRKLWAARIRRSVLVMLVDVAITACTKQAATPPPVPPTHPPGSTVYITYSPITDAPGTQSPPAFKPTLVRESSDGVLVIQFTRQVGQITYTLTNGGPLSQGSNGWLLTVCTFVAGGPLPGDKTLHVEMTNGTNSGEQNVNWNFICSPPAAGG